jgi:SAM-dependent methyltransferase
MFFRVRGDSQFSGRISCHQSTTLRHFSHRLYDSFPPSKCQPYCCLSTRLIVTVIFIKMNCFENWFCASSLWRTITRRTLLPWIIGDSDIGDHVLEIGAGSGAATNELCKRARVTSLEYDPRSARRLVEQQKNSDCDAVCGDAAALPFASKTFSSVIAILVLHHLKSIELQDRAFAEIFRVLCPGGIFVVLEISDTWLHRVGHFKSTFVPISPAAAIVRLTKAGFSGVSCDVRHGGFRIRAYRPAT